MTEVADLRHVVEGDAYNGSPVFIKCPYHGDKIRPNLAVYPDHAYCFACGKYVKPITLVQQLKGVSVEEAEALLADLPKATIELPSEVRVDPIPEGIIEQYQKQLMAEKPALSYLKKRGLLAETISRAKLGYTGWAYTIPIYCRGTLHNIKFRRDDSKPYNPKSPKYWGLPHRRTELFNGDSIASGGIIILTEGEFDALVASQLDGYHGVSLTQGVNSPLSDNVRDLLAVAKTIIIAYDKDMASFNAPLKLAAQLDHPDVRVAMWHASDGKDVSELWVNKKKEFVQTVMDKALRWKRA